MQIGTNTGSSQNIVGRTLADKYRVEEILREDDFGILCLGRHLLMETPVTIKLLSDALSLDPNIVERFSLEAKTISRLSHPNILNVTDFGKDIDGSVFIILEHVEGETVEALIAREGALEPERAARITRQAAAALSAAHSNGIVHRSLSSSNVLVYDAGNGRESTKVLDIGSFSAAAAGNDVNELDLKTVAYLSPEQCASGAQADERSDIYSLGIIFYELLTGEVPFSADSVQELTMKHADVPPPPLAAFRSDVPEEIEPILLNALAKNPDSRFQTAAAFAEDLQEVFAEKEVDEAIVIPQAKVVANNNGWKTAFIILVGITVLSSAFIYFTQVRSADPITQLPTDAGAQPVQPLNPATGVNERGNLMSQLPQGLVVPGDPDSPDSNVGGGDGYDPWANVPAPPRNNGTYRSSPPIGPGGEYFTPDGSQSPFMVDQDGNQVILVPKYVPPADKKTPEDGKSPNPAGNEGNPATKQPENGTKPGANPTKKPEVKKPEVKKDPASKPATPNPGTSKSAPANDAASGN